MDWVSRTEGSPWTDKPLAIMSATAGRAGGERTQFNLRLLMVPFRTRIIQMPEMLLAASSEQFDENGVLVSAQYQKTLDTLMDALRAMS